MGARLDDAGRCGQMTQITSGGFRVGCVSHVTAAKMETEVACVFFFHTSSLPLLFIFLCRVSQSFSLDTNFSTITLFIFLRCLIAPTSTGQEAICLGINVRRNNTAVDINTPEPSRGLMTLASRQTIITGNKEQPSLDPFTIQL